MLQKAETRVSVSKSLMDSSQQCALDAWWQGKWLKAGVRNELREITTQAQKQRSS